MAWPLTWVVIAGTLPGVFIDYWLRVSYLPDPRTFKLFVGCVLLYIGVRLLYEFTGKARAQSQANKALEKKFKERADEIKKRQTSRVAAGLPPEALVNTVSATLTRLEYESWGERFSYSTIGMFILAFVVGMIGGTYGNGGGAIIAPFCVEGIAAACRRSLDVHGRTARGLSQGAAYVDTPLAEPSHKTA